MKASKYNLFFTANGDGTQLIFNGMTGALAKFKDDENYALAKQVLTGCEDIAPKNEEISKPLLQNLRQGGFLVENSVDELALLKVRNRVGRFQQRGFGLTILTTLDCNFRCTYCYQEHQKQVMDKETEDALLQLVQNNLKPKDLFTVTWFGGEPLLRLKQILNVSEKFIDLCDEQESPYSAGIITNGFLFTPKVAKNLQNVRVKNVQITLDGPVDIHNQKRFLQDGSGTYDRILQNIQAVIDADIALNIVIRVNIDKQNYEYVHQQFQLWVVPL